MTPAERRDLAEIIRRQARKHGIKVTERQIAEIVEQVDRLDFAAGVDALAAAAVDAAAVERSFRRRL